MPDLIASGKMIEKPRMNPAMRIGDKTNLHNVSNLTTDFVILCEVLCDLSGKKI